MIFLFILGSWFRCSGTIYSKRSEGKKQVYCNKLKQFAVTLQYYYQQAYTYVRKRFNNLLPHPRTLRRWFMVVDGKPGFIQESF